MIVPTKKVSFETKEDVINYVTKGISPSKKNFNQVLSKSEKLVDSPFTNNDLKLVYENKRRNETMGLIFAGIGMAGAFMFGKRCERKSYDDKIDIIRDRFEWLEF